MCRLMTKQLKTAIAGYPLYSQDRKGKNANCIAIFTLHYFNVSIKWYILEGNTEEQDTILFGVVIGLIEPEYTYISLNELSTITIKEPFLKESIRVELQPDFTPCRLCDIDDTELQNFLSRIHH